ncbi:MAG: 5'/3'-nucleotidase SurE [Cytophagales bacterium]|nr:5'/3'-nucleotidase SurE [Cytophagales bacterium]MDW8384552.1 5'/3'-nucleotidase SurE [Flammeovirgaceae bacterium]
MSKPFPLILITNDDGIKAKGIANLVEAMRGLGRLVVVAPSAPQSGMGHAITIQNPLKVFKTNIFGSDVEAYECNGTPADCIKLAKVYILKNEIPDLVVSGINHGSNSSVSVLYSGTMSAAIEASIEDMPAIGFSLCDYDADADFSHSLPFVRQIAQQALTRPYPSGIALNVNIPPITKGKIKGIKVCRQAKGKWVEKFDERTDPYGRKYLWLTADFIQQDHGEDTDEWALAHQYISVVPISYDMTAYHAMATLNSEWNWDLATLEIS